MPGTPSFPSGLTHKDGPRRSVKGGALLFGMRKALKHAAGGLHLLVDNDADLSVHPAQIGILIEDIVEGRAKAVAGSRREVDSVALIGPSRNTRGHLFIRIWQHWLPELAHVITDTNRAFKAFEVRRSGENPASDRNLHVPLPDRAAAGLHHSAGFR